MDTIDKAIVEENKPKKISWKEVSLKGIQKIVFPSGQELNFDLSLIFPKWEELKVIQQKVIAFGVNKKVSNSIALDGALKTTEEEKIILMQETFDMLVKEKWSTKSTKTDMEKAIQALKKAGIDLSEEQLKKATESKK